ncbi:hypothetical protein GCM10014719_19430 [Planomonospora parontospora subsp. antibiotica]|nr:hypothetical protein GCM10014719_19430 [Planomonospora parontospora subsp. antibiotica]GII15246.1 hypothetical protein Ppa05_19720 [Planomonospora parontospora subsp. antibiotica]
MVALLCSYLFDERTPLNDIYDRPTGRTTQYWTLPFTPGPRSGGSKPVYVLTSGTTRGMKVLAGPRPPRPGGRSVTSRS